MTPIFPTRIPEFRDDVKLGSQARPADAGGVRGGELILSAWRNAKTLVHLSNVGWTGTEDRQCRFKSCRAHQIMNKYTGQIPAVKWLRTEEPTRYRNHTTRQVRRKARRCLRAWIELWYRGKVESRRWRKG